MDKKFKLNKEKCIKCHLCVNDCTTGAIGLDEEGYPKLLNPLKCIKCQHCFAICPNGAISILGKEAKNSSEIKQINPDDLLNLIQSRRSIRQYKKINVSKSEIEKLKQMLNYTPTGCNNHKLHFSIIDDIEVMDDFRTQVNTKLINLLNKKPFKFLSDKLNKFSKYKDAILNGEDVIFRNAPHMIVVSAPISAPCPTQDGIIALSYFELYAQSLNIGTLWCGFAQAILKLFPEFCEYLQIPKGYAPIYVMLFGYSDIKYSRTIQPNEYDFTTIVRHQNEVSFLDKLKRTFWNLIR